ncbi:hypothetical protein [Nocardia sp. NPDC058633]|uniref:hypothetical protein n=1 Tax=Nocardia sp. NPDC058633 TaxID=3346568 RepID=UPI00365BFDD5
MTCPTSGDAPADTVSDGHDPAADTTASSPPNLAHRCPVDAFDERARGNDELPMPGILRPATDNPPRRRKLSAPRDLADRS